MPTDKEIREAKDYILLRLRAERLAVSELDAALHAAALRIAEIAHRYTVPPSLFRFSYNPRLQAEVREVLRSLREAIYDATRELCTFPEDGEDSPFTPAALTAPDHGKTFRERIALYTSRWGYEVEAAIAGAGLDGVTDPAEIAEGIDRYIHDPFRNPWIRDNRGRGEAVRLGPTPHYGKGTAIAAATALDTLLSWVIALAWTENWSRINSDRAGYFVYRGSSFPCEECDSMVGFHTSPDDLPPYHPHCVCFAVYTNDIT